MMDLGAYSDLAMVTTWIMYLLAMAVFGVEWAMARKIAQDEDVAEGRDTAETTEQAGADTAEQASADTAEASQQLVAAGSSAARTGGRSARTPRGIRETSDSTADRTVRTSVSAPGVEATEASDKWGRIALALTGVGVLTNLIGVVLRGIAANRFPWANMYEFTITTVLFMMVAFLVLAHRFGLRWLGLPLTFAATVLVGLAVEVFYVAVADLVPALHSWWFIVHIVAASIAGALMNVGSVLSILYLIRSRSDARGTTRGWLAQLPSPKVMDLWAYRAIAISFPLWTFAIAAGAVWAQAAWGRFWGWDPKETFSLVTWVIYAAYLHARLTAGWKGKRAAIIAIIGLVSFWWNFIGVNFLMDGLHSYSGI